MTELLDQHCPVVYVRRRTKPSTPWFDADCRRQATCESCRAPLSTYVQCWGPTWVDEQVKGVEGVVWCKEQELPLRVKATARNCGGHLTVCWVTSIQMRQVSFQRTDSLHSFKTRSTLSALPLSLHHCMTCRIDRHLPSMSWLLSLLTRWTSWLAQHPARPAS